MARHKLNIYRDAALQFEKIYPSEEALIADGYAQLAAVIAATVKLKIDLDSAEGFIVGQYQRETLRGTWAHVAIL